MLIEFENVTFGYAGDPIVKEVSFRLHENERVGFVGANGAGKTTIIKLLLGELTPDEGSVTKKAGARIGYLEQTGGFESEDTVYGAMEEVFSEDKLLLERLSETEHELSRAEEAALPALSARLESLHKRIAARDSYHFDVRIRTVLNGMGFADRYEQIVSSMSGGEKTRLKLCRLLLEEPDLLVLDEPTNHLDVNTLFWLEDYLTSYKGAILTVSHDRYFLDKITAFTLELDRRTLYSYRGNYTTYKALRQERLLREEREYEKQREEIEKLETYVAKNIVRATTAKSAQSRVKQLQKIQPLSAPVPPPAPPRFSFTYETSPYERVLHCERFDLEIGGKTLLKDASFTLMRGDRCAVIGENGTGKSTLLRFFLSGDPRVLLGRNVKIAYYDQENADLDPEERAIDAFWGKYPLLDQTEARKKLAQAGLNENDVFKKVKELSGGQRARLELTLLQAKHGNTLFLDEPTNHLDLPARESLEDALKSFDGTLLFVSHDRRFLEALATRLIILENGGISVFEGTYQEYLKARIAPSKQPAKPAEEPKKRADGYRTREERARETQKKSRIKEIESRITALEQEEARLNEELIQKAADFRAVRSLTEQIETVQREAETLWKEYEELL